MFRWVIAAALCIQATGCISRPSPRLHHAVFITLTDASQAPELIADCQRLSTIPGVQSCAAGAPFDIGRSAVDGQYDVGLYIGLASASNYQAYLDHPVHTALVTKWKPRWKSVLIRDFHEP